MSASEQKVLTMVAEGKITPQEGEVLLDAMRTKPASRLSLLANPFERIGTAQALGIALVVQAGCFAASRLGVHFDGALDIHVGGRVPSIREALAEAAVGWPVLALTMFVLAKLFRSRGRLIDFVAAIGLARVSTLLNGLVLAALHTAGDRSLTSPRLLATLVVALGGLAWQIVLLYYGTKTASGLTGRALVIALVVGIFAAEAASKGLLALAIPS
jgi:hypothetical protein